MGPLSRRSTRARSSRPALSSPRPRRSREPGDAPPVRGRLSRTTVLFVAVLGASIAAASCSSTTTPDGAPAATSNSNGGTNGSTGSTPGSSPARAETDDYTGFLDQGPLTAERTLQAFALIYGDLPGVETPKDITFPGGTTTDVMLAAAKHWSEFTDEQHAAINDRIGKGHTLTPFTPPKGTTPGSARTTGTAKRTAVEGPDQPQAALAAVPAVAAVHAQPDPIDALVGRALGELQVRLGTTEYPTIAIDRLDTPGVEGDDAPTGTWAMAQPYHDLLGVPSYAARGGDSINDKVCVIHVGTRVDGTGSASLSAVVHEVFHCFQFMSYGGSVDDWNGMPEWIYEASAAWVGEEIADGSDSPLAASWWDRYLAGGADGGYLVPDNNPYLAIGLWEFADTQGEPVWDRLLPILTQTSSGAAYDFIVGDHDKLDTWTSSTYRQSWPPSGAWELQVTNQRPTSAHRTTAHGTIPHGDVQATAPAMAQHAYLFDVSGDAEFVTIEETGPSVASWVDHGPSVRFSAGGKGAYCLIDDCVCPDGSEPFGGHFEQIGGRPDLAVAVTGTGTNGSSVQMSGLTKEDVCHPCDGTSGGSGGDGFRSAMAQPAGDGECPDPCLVGKWKADDADMARQLEQEMGARGHPTTVVVTGDFLFDFEPPTATVTWAYTVTATTPLESGSNLILTSTSAFSGTATSPQYHALPPTMTFEPGDASGLHVVNTAAINGHPTPATDTGMGGAGNVFAGAQHYTCLGPDLTLTNPASPFAILFHRV
jgi:hypothetical protein